MAVDIPEGGGIPSGELQQASASDLSDDVNSLDPVVQAHIGRELRALFDGIAAEPVPDRFLLLLQKLDAKQVTRP